MEGFYVTEADSRVLRQHVYNIREIVFIGEQDCPPEEEWDEFEESSTHYLAILDDIPVGTARVREVQIDGQRTAKLERFAVLKDSRGKGLGRLLVKQTMDIAEKSGYDVMYLHAQSHLSQFYASLGFSVVGDEFDEAGIPHVAMIRRSPKSED